MNQSDINLTPILEREEVDVHVPRPFSRSDVIVDNLHGRLIANADRSLSFLWTPWLFQHKPHLAIFPAEHAAMNSASVELPAVTVCVSDL